jgi:hypothetical protein
MLTNGYAQDAFQQSHYAQPPVLEKSGDFGVPARFIPQKAIAVRRLCILAAMLGAAAIAAVAAIAR